MNYFISQLMNGKSDDEIKEQRNKAIEKIKKIDKDAVILNSFIENMDESQKNLPLRYLAKSIEILADADVAYFCSGWHKGRGCIIEYDCANAYGIEVMEEKSSGELVS